MAALSYKGRFVEYVENGLLGREGRTKSQTIRNFRKYPIKRGETLYHYYGMRTKHCKKIGESICSSVNKIEITPRGVTIFYENHSYHHRIWKKADKDDFAIRDGFANWEEMKRWWVLTHGPNCFPFVGQLIRWKIPPSTIPSGFQSQSFGKERLKSSPSGTLQEQVNEAHLLPGNGDGKEVSNG